MEMLETDPFPWPIIHLFQWQFIWHYFALGDLQSLTIIETVTLRYFNQYKMEPMVSLYWLDYQCSFLSCVQCCWMAVLINNHSAKWFSWIPKVAKWVWKYKKRFWQKIVSKFHWKNPKSNKSFRKACLILW